MRHIKALRDVSGSSVTFRRAPGSRVASSERRIGAGPLINSWKVMMLRGRCISVSFRLSTVLKTGGR